jgi:hypothetical protein
MSEASNLVLDTYTWSVSAAAEGGAQSTEDATGTMTIEIICQASLKEDFVAAFYLDLPDPVDPDTQGVTLDSFPAAATDYTNLPPADASDSLPDGVSCSQSFSYEIAMNPGMEVDRLSLDSATGIFSLENHFDTKGFYHISVTIETTDGVNPQYETISDWHIET